MIPRQAAKKLQDLLKEFPVVTVLGPRQSGKTTLIQNLLSNFPYYNLEDLSTRQFAEEDPYGFMDQLPDGGILDEIQRVPKLLSLIQVIVDKKKKNGLFILSGSHQFLLMKNITQSLAGRTALLHLLPLSLAELYQANLLNPSKQKYIYFLKKGFYPKVHAESVNEYDVYANYYQTYVERDIRELIQIHDLSLFRKFIGLCAGRIGQILNKDSLSRDIGISASTVEQWLSVLEASYILFRLSPYHANLGKRLIKSSKLYFYDVGLACYLLNIEFEDQLVNHPLRGNIFENMQIVEAIKYRAERGKNHNLSFYRDSNGNEIDAVFESAQDISLIEIKSAQTYTAEFLKGIEYFNKNKPAKHNIIVYGGNEYQKRSQFHLVPWFALHQEFQAWEMSASKQKDNI